MKSAKFFSFLLSLCLIFFTTTAFAGGGEKTNQQLRDKVVKIIDNFTDGIANQGETIRLRFMVNSDNEIVVLSTGTQNRALDNYLKSKLNYKKIDVDGVEYGTSYHLSVKFKS